jgi:hypothetical protein
VCDLEKTRIGAPYIYDIRSLGVNTNTQRGAVGLMVRSHGLEFKVLSKYIKTLETVKKIGKTLP